MGQSHQDECSNVEPGKIELSHGVGHMGPEIIAAVWRKLDSSDAGLCVGQTWSAQAWNTNRLALIRIMSPDVFIVFRVLIVFSFRNVKNYFTC